VTSISPLALAILLAGCDTVGLANADSPTAATPPMGFNPQASLAPLVDAVEPAVVNVYSSARRAVPREYQFFFGLPSEQDVQGQGSGFVISADGYILTNNHVVANFSDFKVKFPDGAEHSAKVVGGDPESDVALLKIDAKTKLPFLRLGDSDAIRVGDWVMAVGNPLGLGHTVTAGIVSGKGRNMPDMPFDEFLQTDASINPGNSGGPLIALDGSVVGMNTAIIRGANTVGFAIPANEIADILPQLRDSGKVSRGYLGIEMTQLPEAAQKAIGRGVLVGEETGGNRRGINGGALFFMTLPESGIALDLPLIATHPRTPQPDRGVTPDVSAPLTLADLRAGRDAALETALALAA
jgi:serine protease Do